MGDPVTMRLARVHGVGDMRIDEVPVPAVGPRDVLVRIGATGICGSDLGYIAAGGLGGGAPLAEPLPIGHEFAGVVEQVGGQVRGIRPGQRCAVNPDAGLIGGAGRAGPLRPSSSFPMRVPEWTSARFPTACRWKGRLWRSHCRSACMA